MKPRRGHPSYLFPCSNALTIDTGGGGTTIGITGHSYEMTTTSPGTDGIA